MPRAERWRITLILSGCLAAGLLLAGQPVALQHKIGLFAGALILPLLCLRTAIVAWQYKRQHKRLLTLLAAMLTLLFCLLFIAELEKLIEFFGR